MLPNLASADWEATLKSTFPSAKVVETFDNLQDWSANGLYPSGSGDSRGYDPALLPKKVDGSNSQWQYWANKYPTAIVGTISSGPFQAGETVSNGLGAKWEYRQTYVIDGITYLRMRDPISGSVGEFHVGNTLVGQTSGATATITGWPKIIANQGANTWLGSGKTLMMNLGDNDNEPGAMAGIGAQRLGTFFGDGVTGKSGYKKIDIFMLVKFAPTFFGVTGNQTDVNYISVFKFLDITSGFTSISKYGSTADQVSIEQTSPQTTTEYGANMSVVNIMGGGSSYAGRAFYAENIANATLTPASNPATYYGLVTNSINLLNNDGGYPSGGADINKVYSSGSAAGDWFGLEIISDIGTPDTANGTTELYIYDKSGNIKGHYSATGQLKLTHFDHYYNKITLGGNRRSCQSLPCPTDNTDGRYWIDDLIVNDQRIGPAYFSALALFRSPDTTPPSAPTGLNVQ